MNAKLKRQAGIAFLVLGIGLTAIGMSGQRAFVGVGPVFFILGIVFLARSRADGGKQ